MYYIYIYMLHRFPCLVDFPVGKSPQKHLTAFFHKRSHDFPIKKNLTKSDEILDYIMGSNGISPKKMDGITKSDDFRYSTKPCGKRLRNELERSTMLSMGKSTISTGCRPPARRARRPRRCGSTTWPASTNDHFMGHIWK